MKLTCPPLSTSARCRQKQLVQSVRRNCPSQLNPNRRVRWDCFADCRPTVRGRGGLTAGIAPWKPPPHPTHPPPPIEQTLPSGSQAWWRVGSVYNIAQYGQLRILKKSTHAAPIVTYFMASRHRFSTSIGKEIVWTACRCRHSCPIVWR